MMYNHRAATSPDMLLVHLQELELLIDKSREIQYIPLSWHVLKVVIDIHDNLIVGSGLLILRMS